MTEAERLQREERKFLRGAQEAFALWLFLRHRGFTFTAKAIAKFIRSHAETGHLDVRVRDVQALITEHCLAVKARKRATRAPLADHETAA